MQDIKEQILISIGKLQQGLLNLGYIQTVSLIVLLMFVGCFIGGVLGVFIVDILGNK